VTKKNRLSTPAQLQCSRSGTWEPGNEASQVEMGGIGTQGF